MELFKSINKQTEECPIYISWSSDKECKTKMDTLLEETKCIKGIYSKQKISQFQHYQKLIKMGIKGSYLMFSDDDDIWAPNRVEIMKDCLADSLKNIGEVFSRIIFPNYVELHPHKTINIKGKVETYKEHWTSIVPISVIKDFLSVTPSWIISNPYCDLRFSYYIQCYRKDKITETVHTEIDFPIYFYLIHDDGECRKPYKMKHRHSESLKSIFDNDFFNKANIDINYFSINLEMSIITHYPNVKFIKVEVIHIFRLASEKIKMYIERIWPLIIEWIDRTYIK